MAMMLHVNAPRLRCKGLIVFSRCTNSMQDHLNQIRDQHDCSHDAKMFAAISNGLVTTSSYCGLTSSGIGRCTWCTSPEWPVG
jgi:hypothetical protein